MSRNSPLLSWKITWPAVLLSPVLMLSALWSRMLQLEHYQYLPALFIAILLLLYSRWDRQVNGPTGVWAWVLFSLGVLTLAGTVYVPMPWLGVAGWLLMVGSALLSQRQVDGTSLGSLWPLTWLLTTLPLNFDQKLIQLLQTQSSRLSSYLLDFMGIPHLLLGNVIELPKAQLFVEEACSGVQSVFTLLFLSTLIVVGLRRGNWQLPFYWMAAIFWAMLMNVIRILAIAFVHQRFGWDWSAGWKHTLLGYGTLTIAIMLLLSTDRFFRVLFFPTNPEKSSGVNPLVSLWNRFTVAGEPAASKRWRAGSQLNIAIVLAGCVLLGLHLKSFAKDLSQIVAQAPDESPIVAPSSQLTIDGFNFIEHEHVTGSIDMPYGLSSDVFRGAVGGLPVVIALSQTYPEWHDLCVCYSGIGWKLNDRQIDVIEASSTRVDVVVTRWKGPGGTWGYLLFSGFDEYGQPVRADRYELREQLMERLTIARPPSSTQRVAMVQLFCESDQPLNNDNLISLRTLLMAARQNFLDALDNK